MNIFKRNYSHVLLNVRLAACLNLASQKITCFLLGKCFLSERSGGKSNYRYCRSLWGLEWDLIDRGGRAEGAGGLKGEGEPSKWAGAEIEGGVWVAGALQVNLVFSSPLLWSGEALRSLVVSPIVLETTTNWLQFQFPDIRQSLVRSPLSDLI